MELPFPGDYMVRRRGLAVLLALVGGVPAAAEWRVMHVDPARLVDDVTRAVEARWGRRLKDFSVEVTGPELLTDGEDIRARFDGLTLEVHRWYLGNLPVRGRIDFGPGELDYARLGVGELGVVGEVHGKLYVRIDHAGMSEFLEDAGFQEVGYEWVEETDEFVLWGFRPIKILFFRVRPRIKVRLQAYLEGSDIGFQRIQLFISSIPRFIERIVERRIMKRLSERIHLQDDFDKLARYGIRSLGGVIELYDEAGERLLRVEVPGDPKIHVKPGG